jgi:serine/threonine protein kinase
VLTRTSDLHEGNTLFRLSSPIDDLTLDQLYKKYGKPVLEEVERQDGKPLDPWVPTHGVVAIWFGQASEAVSLADSRIFLIDYSESSQPAVDGPKPSHTPLILRSPELLLNQTSPVSFAAEIWSLACAVFAIMGEQSLFDYWNLNEDRVLQEYVDTLGYLPEEWWAGWANRHKYFDNQLQRVDGHPRRLLNDRLEDSIQEPRRKNKMAEMGEEEKQAFLELMRSMLTFQPDDRPSAQQVLESNWVQKWAMPAFESIKNSF